jgi:hypothetical protein
MLFRFGEIFHYEELAVAFGYADACGVHVGVEDVGAVQGGLHEALVDGGWVWSLVHVFGKPGKERLRRQLRRAGKHKVFRLREWTRLRVHFTALKMTE